ERLVAGAPLYGHPHPPWRPSARSAVQSSARVGEAVHDGANQDRGNQLGRSLAHRLRLVPPEVKTAEARLRYYARPFPLVENDSAYYALPERQQTEKWSRLLPPDFTMNVKAFASLTGHYTEPRRLPRELRESLPPAVRDKRRVYPKDLGEPLVAELLRRF